MGTESWLAGKWRFFAGVVAPIVVMLVGAGGAVFWLIAWTANDVDNGFYRGQSSFVAQAFANWGAEIADAQKSVAIRDEAVINVAAGDIAWMDQNIGVPLHRFFNHDRVAVLDASDQPVYLMRNGRISNVERFAEIASVIAPLAARVRSAPALASRAALRSNPQAAPHAGDIVLVNGVPAIVSIVPILSDTGALGRPAATAPLQVSLVFLDDRMAAGLGQQYQLGNATISTTAVSAEDRGVLPITADSGRIVAFFEWDRDRPGSRMLERTLPMLGAAFAIAAIITGFLLAQIWRFSRVLENGRRYVEYQANHDMLTGLPNRHHFETRLGIALAERKNNGTALSVLMLDLDRFKHVNDTFGHEAGDMLLEQVAERLVALCSPGDTLARLGGDEFAILRQGDGPEADPKHLAARIIEAVSRPFPIKDTEAFVGVSIGIVVAAGQSVSQRELVRKADIALYEAKSAGRNRAMVYEEHMNELLQLRHTIEAELREALRGQDQLSVVYQPLVDVETGSITGAEALSRWHHPKYGQISPAKFIPIAENAGLIELLGDVVLQKACALGARWPGRTLAVNISPAQLRNPKFVTRVFDILQRTGMRAADLALEITESILLDDEHVSSQTLRTFRSAGIHIALDDFGTGYSSLSYLKRYPVDRIKIDRSFISQLTPGNASVAIVQAIVNLAHAMDIDVTAEGVETVEQADILGQLGCNTLQGYLLSPPIAQAEIEALFKRRARLGPGSAPAAQAKAAITA